MTFLNFLPLTTNLDLQYQNWIFSSCCKLRKMSWGEFGIFISQNYSWLGNSCSQHTWIKENYERKKLTNKNAFLSRLQVCLLHEMCRGLKVWMFQWLRVRLGCSSTLATARRTRSSWPGGGWRSKMRKTSQGDDQIESFFGYFFWWY